MRHSGHIVYPIHVELDYEKEWLQYTPFSESNTNGARLWFNSPDTDTSFWAGIQWLDGQWQAAVNTVHRQHYPKLFTRNPIVCFLEVNKACVDVFGILPRILKNLLENENLLCSATAGTKSALGIIQLWFNYFAASFFKVIGKVNVIYLKIPKKSSRAAQKILAGRVFETPGLDITTRFRKGRVLCQNLSVLFLFLVLSWVIEYLAADICNGIQHFRSIGKASEWLLLWR